MILFTTETFEDFWRDAQHIFPVHWKELALDQDKIELGIDADRFSTIGKQGMLHIVTARDDDFMFGYYVAIVMPHLHYKDSGVMAFTDMYYILPEYRKGGCGAKFLIEVERTLRERGVVKAYISSKLHQDHSALFEALGWRPSDISFVKCLGAN